MTKTVLITGTSSGIGKATALKFLEEGWQVAATMRQPEGQHLEAGNRRASVIKLDVTDPAEADRAISETISQFGSLDVVINNAGYATTGPFELASENEIRRQFDTNLFGVMNVVKAALPHFRSVSSGLFINVSSALGIESMPYTSLYSSSKWALEGLSESLLFELSPHGISVRVVEPGVVETSFAKNVVMLSAEDNPYAESIEAFWTNFAQTTPEQPSSAEEVAGEIYKAAVSEGPQFRFVVGKDAIKVATEREKLGRERYVLDKLKGYDKLHGRA